MYPSVRASAKCVCTLPSVIDKAGRVGFKETSPKPYPTIICDYVLVDFGLIPAQHADSIRKGIVYVIVPDDIAVLSEPCLDALDKYARTAVVNLIIFNNVIVRVVGHDACFVLSAGTCSGVMNAANAIILDCDVIRPVNPDSIVVI